MISHSRLTRTSGTTMALAMLLAFLPASALAQSAPDVAPASVPGDAIPDLASGMVAIPFSVAGPVGPDDTALTLLVVDRGCGVEWYSDETPPSDVHVAETEDSISIRVDVEAGPDGRSCDHDRLIEVPVVLDQPLEGRSIVNAADPERLPPVNAFAAIETSLRYTCGWGTCSVADLLGPGLDVSRHGLTPPIRNARAVYDAGDVVTWFGAYDPVRRRFACATARYVEGEWQMFGQTCRPHAVMFDGVDAASWRLRGKRPDPRDRSIRIWVQERVCNGSPIRPRLQRPVVQYEWRKGGAIVIVMATTRQPTDPPQRRGAAGKRLGFVDCPGMAPVKAIVDLPVAIGKRPLLDGYAFPPQERWAKRQ